MIHRTRIAYSRHVDIYNSIFVCNTANSIRPKQTDKKPQFIHAKVESYGFFFFDSAPLINHINRHLCSAHNSQ